jgi:hypothetical protein
MTTDVDTLCRNASRVARCGTPERALDWLRAVASTLADWGGDRAKAVLEAALPAELFKGRGSSGRSYEKALKDETDAGRDVVLIQEVARRVKEPDPGQVGVSVGPLVGLLKAEMTAAQVDELIVSLPPFVAEDVRRASVRAPWGYGLIPQSYARPTAKRPNTAQTFVAEKAADADEGVVAVNPARGAPGRA